MHVENAVHSLHAHQYNCSPHSRGHLSATPTWCRDTEGNYKNTKWKQNVNQLKDQGKLKLSCVVLCCPVLLDVACAGCSKGRRRTPLLSANHSAGGTWLFALFQTPGTPSHRTSQKMAQHGSAKQLLPATSSYFQLLPDTSRYFQILPDTSRYFQILPDTSRYFQILPDTSRYFQILPDTLQHCYTATTLK